MPNGGYRIPAESLLQPNEKDWIGKKINKDNQTEDCKWINIERRGEKRLKEKMPRIDWAFASYTFFHFIDQASQRLRVEPTLLILSGTVKCILLGLCISLLFFSIYFFLFSGGQTVWILSLRDTLFHPFNLWFPLYFRIPGLPVRCQKCRKHQTLLSATITITPIHAPSLFSVELLLNTLYSQNHTPIMVWYGSQTFPSF